MSDYESAVRAWADHLRAGGTTQWSSFWPTAPRTPGADELPGAAQLELVRRLGLSKAGHALADRVLDRDGPGRGVPRLPLVHPDAPTGYGVPPVDPGAVPVRELIRIGIGVLADVLVEHPAPTREQPRRTLELRRRPLVLGAPVTRTALARGVSGFSRKDVLICAPTLDELLAEVWSTRVQLGARVRWKRFVEIWHGQDALPTSADVVRLAETAATRVGVRRVHVLVGSSARRDVTTVGTGDPVPLTVESLDVLRRLNPVLAVRLRREPRDLARAEAVRLLRGARASRLAVPVRQERWVRDRAARVAEELTRGDYAVHGDLDEFVAGVRGPRRPRVEAVLDRLLDVLRQVEERC